MAVRRASMLVVSSRRRTEGAPDVADGGVNEGGGIARRRGGRRCG